MIIGSDGIRKLLENDEIFRAGTFNPANIKEASYALRVAVDGLIIDGQAYPVGHEYPQDKMYQGAFIEIKPGRIAVLSTQEELKMPNNLVGRLGIRLNFAAAGLSGLMGIQVDPYYGQDYPHERLFIRVANLGNDPVRIKPGDPVFNVEFSEVSGVTRPPHPKGETWDRVLEILKDQTDASWTHLTRVQENVDIVHKEVNETIEKANQDINENIRNVRQGLQPLVMFGIFLVAVTILGVVVTVLLSVRDVPEVEVPIWVTDWGWAVLLFTLSAASVATAAIGVKVVLALGTRERP